MEKFELISRSDADNGAGGVRGLAFAACDTLDTDSSSKNYAQALLCGHKNALTVLDWEPTQCYDRVEGLRMGPVQLTP